MPKNIGKETVAQATNIEESIDKLKAIRDTLSHLSKDGIDAVMTDEGPLLVGNAQTSVTQSEARYRHLVNRMEALVVELTPTGEITYLNDAITLITGYSSEEWINRNWFDLLLPIQESTHPETLREQFLDNGELRAFRTGINTLDGGIKFISWSSAHVTDANGMIERLIFFGIDVTDQILGEQELRIAEDNQNRLTRALKLLSKCNSLLVTSTSEQELLAEICRLAVKTGDYLMAWIGVADHDAAKTVRPVARYGHDEGYLDAANISWADTERGQGPTGTAIRTEKVVFNDMQNSPCTSPWHDAAIVRGYKNNIALPLSGNQGVWGALSIYSNDSSVLGNKEVELLTELAKDISFGVQALRTRHAHDEAQIYLQRENEKNRALLRNSSDGVHIIDTQGNIIEASDSFCVMLGYQREQVIGMNVIQWDAKLTQNELLNFLKVQVEKKGSFQFETRHRRKDGTVFDVEINSLSIELNSEAAIFCSSRDITGRMKVLEEQRIAATAFEVHEGILITDASSNILRVNKAFSRITGYAAEEVVGKSPRILNSYRHDAAFYAEMWKCIQNTGSWDGEIWNRRKNGEIYPEYLTITAVKNSSNVITNYVGAFTDITKSKKAEESIRELAFFDPLTKLANRRLLQDRLLHAMSSSDRNGETGALFFIDLDNFKTINDTLGHAMGDILLQQVAERLKSCLRAGDTVSRLGGDEFVMMLEGLSKESLEAATEAETIGEKIIKVLNKPYCLGEKEYLNTASIGITLFNGDNQIADDLFKRADIAMYQAKKAGRNTLRFFDPIMQEAINTRVFVERELRSALESNQFQLNFQIQMHEADEDGMLVPCGAEVLIRWNHPTRGIVSPADFIPLAEETGDILAIGQWVLEEACAQLMKWKVNDLTRDLVLAVNVSAKQFHQKYFMQQVIALVEKYGIDPRRLKLELTESMLVDEVENTIATMSTLREFGISFSLDDFGTGYSSLQYLKRLPLDQLKIDLSFVKNIVQNASDRAIVRTIIAMAQSLNIDVIAEGVEVEEQHQILLNKGCSHFQGYLFSKPLAIAQFESLLKELKEKQAAHNGKSAPSNFPKESLLSKRNQHLSAVLDNIPAMIGYWDKNLRNRFGNDAYATWFGVLPSKLLGMNLNDLLGEKLSKMNSPYIEAALRGERQEFERSIPTPDGKSHRHSLAEYIPDIVDGEVRGFYVHVADVTALKESEKKLISAVEAAEAASKAKSTFLSTMSHELRTPMNGVMGMAQLLQMPDLSEADRLEFATTLLSSGQEMVDLITSILEYVKFDSNHDVLKPDICAPGIIVKECCALKKHQAEEKGLNMEISTGDIDGHLYILDSSRLRQMLGRLLDNAIKFTQSGHIRIEVKMNKVEGDTAELEFAVVDTGIGIPLDKQHLLFEAFTQVDGSHTRSFGGTGLGLATVKRLAELMNGSVGVESEEGKGSRFWFTVKAPIIK